MKMAPRPRSVQALDSRRTRGSQSYRCRVCRGINSVSEVPSAERRETAAGNSYQ